MVLSPEIVYLLKKPNKCIFILQLATWVCLHSMLFDYNTQNTPVSDLNDHYLFRRYKQSFTKAVKSVQFLKQISL